LTALGQRDRGSARVVALALVAALFWAYWPTLAGLARRWSEDPQYSHGYVVPVIAVVVLWHRRRQFPTTRTRVCWWGLAPLTGGAALRAGAAYLHFDWLDAVSILPTLAGTCLLAGGWALVRWAWPAVVLACFMLPLPYQAEIALAHPLQRFATHASTYALQTLGLPAVAEGNVILVDDIRIGVLEACSGLGMLVTFFALSTAVAFVTDRPWPDRLILLFSAIPIGVLANVTRITATGVLHQSMGSAVANAFYHDLAGWLMMPFALALLGLEMLFLSRLFTLPGQRKATPVSVDARSSPRIPTPIPGR
jgi:exosortase